MGFNSAFKGLNTIWPKHRKQTLSSAKKKNGSHYFQLQDTNLRYI